MFAAYLQRGVKAGLVAGLVFGLFVALVANPLVAYADELNHAGAEHTHAEDGDGHGSAVSTAVNKTVSVVSSALWAVLVVGVVFGIAFYFLEPVVPGTGATKSYVLGGAGFVTVSGAPWLVLPPVAQQSLPASTWLPLYGGMMVAGALACLLAGGIYNRLRASNGPLVVAAGGVTSLGLLVIPATLAPTNTVQGSLSPTLRAGLSGLFVFGQLLLWTLLAALHARFDSEWAATTTDSLSTAD